MPVECPFVSKDDLLRYIYLNAPARVNLSNSMTHAFVKKLLDYRLIACNDVSVAFYDLDAPPPEEEPSSPGIGDEGTYVCTSSGLLYLAQQQAIEEKLRQQALDQKRERDAERADQQQREKILRREDRVWRILALVVPSIVAVSCVFLTAWLT